jgi:hypothetical protein
MTSSSLGHSGNKYSSASVGITSIMTNNTNTVGNSSGLSSSLRDGMHHHHTSSSTSAAAPSASNRNESSTVTWAPTPNDQKSTEIDRIMAKIEQARLSIANVCVLIRKKSNSFNTFTQNT